MAALVASPPPATSCSNTETNEGMDMAVLPMAWSEGNPSIVDHRNRIAKIQQLTGNRFCADCHAESPQWSSILLTSNESGKVVVEGFGVVICEQCAVHHLQELGEERCFLKYLQYFHEWTPDELDILEFSGNLVSNGVYEAKLSTPKEDQRRCRSSSKQQGKFIKRKYRKLRYYQQERFNQALEAIAVRIRKVEAMRKRRKSLEQVHQSRSSSSPIIISQVTAGVGSPRGCSSMDNNNASSSTTSSEKRRRGSNNRTSLRMSSVFRGRGPGSNNFKQGSSMDFSGSSVLSMAESMVGSSCGFDLEDDEDFFLACARATANNGSATTSDEESTTTAPPIIRADSNNTTAGSGGDGIFWDENCLPQFRDETAQEEDADDDMIEEEEVARTQPEKKTLPGISSSTSSLSSSVSARSGGSANSSNDQCPRQPHRHASPHRRRRSSKETTKAGSTTVLPKVLSPMRRNRKTMLRRMLNSKEYSSSSEEEELNAGNSSSNRRKSDSNIMSIVPLVHQRGRTRRASAPPDVAAAAVVTTTPSNPIVEQTNSAVGRATTTTSAASTAATQGEETDAISTTTTTTTTTAVAVELNNNKPAERTRSLSPCPSPAQREIVPQAA